MTRQLTKDQRKFWEQLTSDYDEYNEKHVMNDVMELLASNADLVVKVRDADGFHILEERLAEKFDVERVHISKDFQTMSYRIVIIFRSGNRQSAFLNEEIVEYGIHNRSYRR